MEYISVQLENRKKRDAFQLLFRLIAAILSAVIIDIKGKALINSVFRGIPLLCARINDRIKARAWHAVVLLN